MNANTVYEVFLALSEEEKEKFFVLVKAQNTGAFSKMNRQKSKKIRFTKQDAIEYLLATVFKPKN
ncbi:hypothetical protein [Flavobacterium litorale]|uniref:50S ribosomal protein L23 n=1 Tax=Flavobacterium litorale TaxID=2856519 RepID=A0ABX8V623_9FLAO|nr:hypothetical protein [Flavobacterium litorale]QYJ68281.1 hypothetical protein K1I41_12270 [Flavobacterium litorale]